MVVADYFPMQLSVAEVQKRASRLMYGTDFPNIPFAWDRELTRLAALPLDAGAREKLFWGNAAALFGD